MPQAMGEGFKKMTMKKSPRKKWKKILKSFLTLFFETFTHGLWHGIFCILRGKFINIPYLVPQK